jgi:xanthine dehydrogenase small subunit
VLELPSPRGVRELPYREFCTGYRKTALPADELIAHVRVPAQPAGAQQLWRKVGTRRAQSISKVMAAAVLGTSGGTITHARIGLGAVADRPIRARAVEAALLAGGDADVAAAALAADIHPISDVRSTADYRLATAQNLIRRFVRGILPA